MQKKNPDLVSNFKSLANRRVKNQKPPKKWVLQKKASVIHLRCYGIDFCSSKLGVVVSCLVAIK